MTTVTMCAFEGCGRPVKHKGLCKSHYMQQWRGEQLRPLRLGQRQDANGKVCSSCKEYKPWSEFYRRSNGDTYQSECSTCMSQRSRRNYLKRIGKGLPV